MAPKKVGVPASPANGTSAVPRRERIAIVRGLRTPFAKQGTAYARMSALDLGALVVRELLARAELDPNEVELVVYGQVVPSLEAPNIAREIVLGTGMPKDIEAFSVSRACATSFQAMTSAAEAMLAGQSRRRRSPAAPTASSDVPIARRGSASRTRWSRRRRRAPSRTRSAPSPSSHLATCSPCRPLSREPTTGAHDGRERREDGQGERASRARSRTRSRTAATRARRARGATGLFADEVMHVMPAAAYDTARRRGQPRPQGLDARGVREAQAGLRSEVRDDHRGQLVAAHRRRERARSS